MSHLFPLTKSASSPLLSITMTDFPTVDGVELEGSLPEGDSSRLPLATADPWHRSDRLKQTRILRRALAFQRRLENAAQGLVSLSSSLSMTELQAPHAADVIRLATDVTTSSFGLNDFFSDLASTTLHNERRSHTGCPARAVFDVPELLEHILSYLNAKEILRASEVDWTMYRTIEASPKLQAILHLRPSPTGFLETPFSKNPGRPFYGCASSRKRRLVPHNDFPGFYCYSRTNINVPARAAIFAQLSYQLPRIGARCRSMLICQPPIYEMGVYPLCCTTNPYYSGSMEIFNQPLIKARAMYRLPGSLPEDLQQPPFEVVRSEKGITVGDLYDMVIRVRQFHGLCPWASPEKHDVEGNVVAHVSCGGIIQLKDDDPAVVRYPSGDVIRSPNRRSVPPHLSPAYLSRPFQLLERYVEAKRRGEL